jgi:uncharacterized protein (DUF4415 family)
MTIRHVGTSSVDKAERKSYWTPKKDVFRSDERTYAEHRISSEPAPIMRPEPEFHEQTQDDKDAAVLLEALAKAIEPHPERVGVNTRIDADVVEWLRSQGGSLSARINNALRALMALHRSRE